MDFDWHDDKSEACRRERGFGFDYAVRIFTGPVLERIDDRRGYGETRVQALGEIDGLPLRHRLHRPDQRERGAGPLDHLRPSGTCEGAPEMARRTLGDIMGSAPDVDYAHLASVSETDIRRHAHEDGHDPDGETDGYRMVLPPRAVRERLGLTQAAFAAALRVPIGTVRNWEQARTLPDPAARSLLDAVAAEPAAVLAALRSAFGTVGPNLTHGTEKAVADAAPSKVLDDAHESPLARMARRRGRDGRPLFDASAFEAGERLRRDLGLAFMLPHMDTSRSALPSDADSSHDPAGASDTVVAARRRVRDALAAVGSDLSGLLLDVCGFLKSLERIEAERRWPARSAKVVARIALGRLAEHYSYERKTTESERIHTQVWRNLA